MSTVALNARVVTTGIVRRLESIPVVALLVGLAVLQWVLALVTGLSVGHSGSLAAVVAQVVLLLPLALVLVHALASRLAGRAFAAWAALVWVVVPYAGLLYSNSPFRRTYAHDLLPTFVGLAADARFAAMVGLLAGCLFAVRVADRGRAVDVAATIAATGAAIAFTPVDAWIALAPVAIVALGGRRRQAAAVAAGLAIVLAIVAALTDGLFGHVAVGAAFDRLPSLRETFWSGRVLEWLVVGGLVGALRRRLDVGVGLTLAVFAAFFAVPGRRGPDAVASNLDLVHGLLPVWGLLVLAAASIPLLAPHSGRAGEAASIRVRRAWDWLRRPLTWPIAAPAWASCALGATFVVMTFVGIWNAQRYPVELGYDASLHLGYADSLIQHGTVPAGGEFYTPPAYYALAGSATWLGTHLGMTFPHQAAQYLNLLFVLGTAVLLLVLARLLFPRSPIVWVASLAFFAFLPVVPKTAAMFYPETLNMLASTASITVATMILLKRRFTLPWLGLLAALLAFGQLVRVSNLFTVAAIGITFVAALATADFRRTLPLRKIAIAVGASLILVSPWYVRQAVKTGDPIFGKPAFVKSLFHPSTATRVTYLSLSTDMYNRPFRPFSLNQVIPETYDEIWGDWIGVWAWSGYSAGPPFRSFVVMRDQVRLGALPTLLALAGYLGLVAMVVLKRVPRIPFLPVVLLPAIALGAYLWRGYVTPTADGDLYKASYLLTTAPVWALCFGIALNWLRRWRGLAIGLAVVLLVSAIFELRFILYGLRDHNEIF
jgi:hypothetical protein